MQLICENAGEIDHELFEGNIPACDWVVTPYSRIPG
jgi:hypothetical protein